MVNLDKAIEVAVSVMGESLKKFDYKDKEKYAQFLAQTFHYVSHSTRLLAFAAGVMPLDNTQYFRRYVDHISEEKGHENIAKKDLELFGFDMAKFPELSCTKMFWEPQYFKIQHQDPIALMGYIIALEVFSAQCFPAFYKDLQATYDEKVLRFVKIHAEEDQDHIVKAIDLVKNLSEDRMKLVVDNIHQTGFGYSLMLDSIMDGVSI